MRLDEKFKQLREEKRKAFIGYVPFGFPNPELTKDIVFSLQEAGVDIVELGIPFSDPLADGPIIQKATTLALEKGATIEGLFREFEQLKNSLKIPIVIMTYYNPVFKFGLSNFFETMHNLGMTAITIVDLPLEESADYIKKARKFDLDTIFFITPTTSCIRMKKIATQSKGFIYYISVTGITGPKSLQYASLQSNIRAIKRVTKIPVCVGFGIHRREQIDKINKFSDGVIVGSGIVKFIDEHYRDIDFLSKLKKYTRSLTA